MLPRERANKIEHTYYSVEAGDLLLLRSNVAHAEVSLAANPMECIVLGFSAANALPDLLTPNVFRVLHLDSSANQIQSYLSLMLQEVTKRRPRYAEVCQHLFEALLIQLIREFSPTLMPIDKDAPLSKKAEQIKEFIEKHYLENITLESLAQPSKLRLANTTWRTPSNNTTKYPRCNMFNRCVLMRRRHYSVQQISLPGELLLSSGIPHTATLTSDS